MLIIPTSHDSFQSRRWPWVTIALIVINLLVFGLSARADVQNREAVEKDARDAVVYWVEHPYLRLPPPLDANVPRLLADRRLGPKIREGQARQVEPGEVEEQQKELDRLAAVVTDPRRDYRRVYGFVPARNNWTGLVTSQFLHGGVLHILFNLWFLWLVGVNMEDRWGRVVFPLFYLSAGAVACLAHKAYAPQSEAPLIGASGAVAGAMGAFLVGFAKTKIRFMWLVWLRPYFFEAPAYLMLPLWLLGEVFSAWLGYGKTGGSGVAYAAHVGGFLFGVVIALGMRFTGAERRIDDAIENDGAVLQDPRILRAAALTDAGDPQGALAALTEAAAALPGSIDVQLEMLRAAKAAGDGARERAAYTRLVGLYLREEMGRTALDFFEEMQAAGIDGDLAPAHRLRLAVELERAGQANRAATELGRLHAGGLHDAIGLKAALAHAELCLRLRRREEALRLFEEVRGQPDLPPPLRAQVERGMRDAEALPDLGMPFPF